MGWPVEELTFDGTVVGDLALAIVGGRVLAFVADFLAKFRAARTEAFATERREMEVPHLTSVQVVVCERNRSVCWSRCKRNIEWREVKKWRA